jgi:hypothetical protein
MRYGKIESRESAGNREEEPERMQEESEPVNGESDGTDCTERKRKRGDSAGGVGAAITVTLIAMGCALAMFRFRSLAAPGGKNYLLYTGIMAACLAVSVIAAFSGTVLSRRADKSRKKETDGSAGEAPRPFCEYTAEAAQKPSAGQKDADPFGTAQYPYDDSYDAGRGPAAEEETTDCDFVGRLYGTESNSRKYRIDLGTLPCTVGRAPGYSDKILGDPSVSGVHARFFRREADGTVAVQDLNSGSGTYINGQRLLPNASGEILPGDEIRIGRLCFCYR